MNQALDTFLWETHWHLACHRSELLAHGDFLRLTILDREVVVFNDHGEIIAFDNRCPHRGARIYLENHGNQAATCAYHGWTFNRGQFFIPGQEHFKGCDLNRVDFRRWQTEWVADFLFVGVAPNQAIEDQLGDVQPILEDISFGVMGRHDWNAYDFQCDWKIAIENALEPYHVDLVHPHSLGVLDLQAGQNDFHGKNSIWYAPLGNAKMANKLARISEFFSLDFQYKGYASIYIYPFTMLSSTFGYSYSLQHFLPSSLPNKTHFYSRLLTMALKPGRSPELMNSLFASTAETNRRVFEEDHQICQRVPADTWSPEPPRYASDTEAKLLHFRASCREALQQMINTSSTATSELP
ncbi:MAG: Rieske (2Fe-2S) protein [Rubrivivax sp.]|nr:MAG: Rieske (2Fe-2S) protein [Rubrivivax sp.]